MKVMALVNEPVNVGTLEIYNATKGYLGYLCGTPERPSVYWRSCREEFHGCINSPKDYAIQSITPWFFCLHGPGENGQTPARLNEYITRTEALLGIEQPTTVAPVKGIKKEYGNVGKEPVVIPGIVAVTPSPWWMVNEIRRQFLTCAMRAAMPYDGTNYFQCLRSYKYFKITHKAMMRFLDGYTHYTGDAFGWVNAFHIYDTRDTATNDSDLAACLVKPPQ